MEERVLSELTDEELIAEQKSLKSFSIINAFLIGFLMGIIVVGVVFKAGFFVLLIPLFLIYKFFNDPRNKRVKELDKMLKERNYQNNPGQRT